MKKYQTGHKTNFFPYKYSAVVCPGRLCTPSLMFLRALLDMALGNEAWFCSWPSLNGRLYEKPCFFTTWIIYCLTQWYVLIPWPFKKRQYQLQTISSNLRMPTETGIKKYVLTFPLLWAVLPADKTGTNTVATTRLKQAHVWLAGTTDKGSFILLPSSMSQNHRMVWIGDLHIFS